MASINGNKFVIMETRPKMLKDFLHDNSTSCSSSGFTSFPRRLPEPDPTVRILLDQAAATSTLPRSRSSRSRAAFSSFQKLLNAVKSVNATSPSSPTTLTLSRSISRRLLGGWTVKKRRSSNTKPNEGIMKVKDILRWKSFRDLVHDNQAEKPPPSDLLLKEYNDVVLDNTITTPRRSSGSSSSNGSGLGSGSGSSWADSEFSLTVDELPCWWGNSIEEGKKWKDDVGVTDSQVGPNEGKHSMASEEDKEQHSPISVLDSPFREEISDEELVYSSFDQSLANVERTKQRLLESLQWFESLAGVSEEDNETKEEEEISDEKEQIKYNSIKAKSRVNLSRAFGRQGLKEKEECIKDMAKQGHWSKFEEERGELVFELEFEVLSDMVNEVLLDLFG